MGSNHEMLDMLHWQREDHKQRITREQWREILLSGDDTIICRGSLRKLKAKNLGVGVLEISKEPLEA